MAKSFLKRVSPSRERTKVFDWPFPVEGDVPKVRISVLGTDKLEAANLATHDHFATLLKGKKKAAKEGDVVAPVSETDTVFVVRERAELVFRAYEVQDGDEWVPLADNTDELMLEADGVQVRLYQEWAQFQASVTARPTSKEEMDDLVELLKKKCPRGSITRAQFDLAERAHHYFGRPACSLDPGELTWMIAMYYSGLELEAEARKAAEVKNKGIRTIVNLAAQARRKKRGRKVASNAS